MYHYALGIEYDGTLFHGFQTQAGAQATVQANLERAISQVADEPIRVTFAGRTDVGVHATQQVIGFSSQNERSSQAWIKGTNRYLNEATRHRRNSGIGVTWAKEIEGSFNPRFCALWRRYLYIFGHRANQQVFTSPFATWVDQDLDTEAMGLAASAFLGDQDFSSVRASSCQSLTPQRYVYLVNVHSINQFVVIDIAANAFLHHMVRNIAAILYEVGIGNWNQGRVEEVLMAKNRSLAPATAKASGLFLVAVGYDPKFEISSQVRVPAILGPDSCVFQDVELPCDHYRREIHR